MLHKFDCWKICVFTPNDQCANCTDISCKLASSRSHVSVLVRVFVVSVTVSLSFFEATHKIKQHIFKTCQRVGSN